MADHNTYLQYKRDERHLVYWIIHASAHIIKKFPSHNTQDINLTGAISLSTLKSLSQLIAKHIDPIPTTIFRLFASVIDARKRTQRLYIQTTTSDPDPEIQKSNVSHQHWIEGLSEAFNLLGGETWQEGKKDAPDTFDEDEDAEDGAEEDTGIPEAAMHQKARRSTQKPKKKGNQSKRGRKPKTKGKTAESASVSDLQEIPLESYRIIEGETGMITDYLMAVYSITEQLIRLRHELQGAWYSVAYQGMNTAVASSLCKVAIGMIKDAQLQIFVEFPGHDSFDTVMQTMTRRDPDKAKGMFGLAVTRLNPDGTLEQTPQSDIDVREEFLMYTYQDLFDFITDYQKTRSGKPTKAMLKCIQDWDPYLNLLRATKEQRLKWRRAFTINWLYDLVNVFSSVAVQRRTMRGQNIPLETVDWSRAGPWNEHRRLFGINEFAGDITHLAVQKPGTDIKSKILPHHVFQLQCIVESLTVSRGWSISVLTGHVLKPAAKGFRPRRDVDLFMDRDNKRFAKGFCSSVEILSQLFDEDAMIQGEPNRNRSIKELMSEFLMDFVDWLGESKYMHGLTAIPPSRFSNTNSNGLWEYCPFLCGAGLSEALELTHSMAMRIWGSVPEPICVSHLHNMLVQKGLLSRPVGLWSSVAQLFQSAFFKDGKVPRSHFAKAFQALLGGRRFRRENLRSRAQRRRFARNAKDVHDLLDPSENRFYKERTLLQIFDRANWIPARIPDEEIPLPTGLALMRLAQTKQTRDPVTGKVTLAESDLAKRVRSCGASNEDIVKILSTLPSPSKDPHTAQIMKTLQSTVPEGWTVGNAGNSHSKADMDLTTYLDLLRLDFISDICGELRPISSLNYIMILVRCYALFMRIEDNLKKCRNPTWVQVHERNFKLTDQKRLSLTLFALAEADPEYLRIMADVFEEMRDGFLNNIYWDDFMDIHETLETFKSGDQVPFGPDSSTTIPSNHPIFNNRVPPVPALLDFPIVVHRVGTPDNGAFDHLDNQAITYIHITTETGLAPPEWQSGIGTVIVARKDKKDLSPEHYEAIWMYCDHILDYFGEGEGAPKHLFTRQAFERWFVGYQKEQLGFGRQEWTSVPPLYEE
ncbi:Uncharacterized conserved protein UCP028035 [Penicillium expansum]|uniref:Uncharacterized conserved protein UCP028035 n=1 Tax=Penicillium expansum TaxID=27334 RepID=A0A0A2K9R1_PENEN|nr:Uncharacterized conserved protein UCP028035 [Penicillium expansum]KGO50194.1 Uncharacterized conserved protein UCP028035 [Penicillium expansum]KGO61095.1 Uncharacterized conserved protein UCP028035 [Penicillium expansum]